MASFQILNRTTAGNSGPISVAGVSNMAVQASVKGSGAVSAIIVITASVDGNDWVTLGTITLGGTNSSTDGFSAPMKPWTFAQANLTYISGTSAYVTVSLGW